MAARRAFISFLLAVLALIVPGAAIAQPVSSAASAPTAVQQPAPAAPNSRVAPYRINPGDELQVFVWGEERLQRSVRVLPDGSFSFPLVGRVEAMNRLPTELEGEISAGLKSQYRGEVPQVTVSVVTPAGLQFSVVGKVRNPGTFNPGRYVNVLEALSFAGGPTDFAKVDNITVIRKDGERLTSFQVRLGDLLRGSARNLNEEQIPAIHSGDTVIVP